MTHSPEEDGMGGTAGELRVEAEAFQRMFDNHGAVMYIVDLATIRLVDADKSAVAF